MHATETFLPFELEVAYGAALHLMMANTLFPHAVEGQTYSGEAHCVLDEMISKGNRLAAARKTELTHLEGLFRELATRIERYGLQTLTLTTPNRAGDETIFDSFHEQHLDKTTTGAMLDTDALHGEEGSSPPLHHLANGVERLDEIGISSYEFLSIIEQIGGTDSSVLDSAV